MVKRLAVAAMLCVAPLLSTEPLGVATALGIREIANRSPISFSPDGEWIAYAVEDPSRHESTSDARYRSYTPTGVYRESQGCDVWITDTHSGVTLNLTESRGSSWGPVWSPDGKWLAFYSDRGGTVALWLWERATRTMKPLSNAIPRPYFNFAVPRWTPDSRRVLIKALPEGVTLEAALDRTLGPAVGGNRSDAFPGSTVTVLRSSVRKPEKTAATGVPVVDNQPFLNQYAADLALIEIATGRVNRIATGVRPVGYWISPDGASVAYTNAKGSERNTQQMVYSLEAVPTTGGQQRVLVAEVKQTYGLSVQWAPDSRNLAYTTFGQTAKGDCWVVPAAGGPLRNLTPKSHPNFGDSYHSPYWSKTGDALFAVSSGKVWKIPLQGGEVSVFAEVTGHRVVEIAEPSAGGSLRAPAGIGSMIVMTRNAVSRDSGFHTLDPTGKSTLLFETPILTRGAFDIDVSADGSLAFISQDATHPDDIWIAHQDLRTPRRITRLNPQIETVAFGSSRLIDWTSTDGEPLHGALLLPAGYETGKKYPLVVNVYGGSNLSESVHRFGLRGSTVDNMQLLATRGYAVLLPDAPLHTGTPMTDLFKTVMPGIDRAIALGIADPNRIGVMGHSYGGYSTLSLIVQSTRFRAAVASAGPANLVSLYGRLDAAGNNMGVGWSETGQGRMEGSPWQYRERYIENSPLFYLDRVKTPLLIVQGRLDHAVPEEQSDQVFVGLRRLGREVEYARYAGEEHWQGTWSAANATDYWNRVLRWFDGHLKGEPTSDAK